MIKAALESLHIEQLNPGISTGTKHWHGGGKEISSMSPVDGSVIGKTNLPTESDYNQVMEAASKAFQHWRQVPAPRRGEIVRLIGNRLREHKDALGQLVSYEMGKSLQEGWGEVQEMIDICDFAVGLSRQL